MGRVRNIPQRGWDLAKAAGRGGFKAIDGRDTQGIGNLDEDGGAFALDARKYTTTDRGDRKVTTGQNLRDYHFFQ